MRISGIVHRSDLARRGHSESDVEQWLRDGAVRRVQQWYVTLDAPTELVALLRLGVRPTCVDAAAIRGLWVPARRGAVHVFRPRMGRGTRAGRRSGQSPRRQESGESSESLQRSLSTHGRSAAIRDVLSPRVVGAATAPHAYPLRPSDRAGLTLTTPAVAVPLAWHGPALRAWPDLDPVPAVELVLEHAGRCLEPVDAATIFESAVHEGQITLDRALDVIAVLPANSRRALCRIRGDAESGTETTVRWWLESRKISVRSQVWIPGVGRVDLLVGESWVIECDSRRYHDTDDGYQRDRARDLELRALGYTVTRLTWEQVFVSWFSTQRSLLAVIARDDHRRALADGRGALRA